MSMIDSLANTGPRIPEQRPVRGYQSLSQMSEQRSVTQNAETAGETRQRMGSTLSIGEERSLIDATRDIAANLFNAFRNEMREALNHVGIRGEAAADLIRDVGKSFVEAVRSGTGFSFGMIAVAYQETLTQTATSVSHALEFTANALSLEYNHATGEITADTSKLEIDAVKVIQGDNLPANAAAALFDFTDSDGPPSIASIFDRVQQYLVNNGFIGEEGDEATLPPPLPAADEALYDAVLVNDKKGRRTGTGCRGRRSGGKAVRHGADRNPVARIDADQGGGGIHQRPPGNDHADDVRPGCPGSCRQGRQGARD